MLIEPSLLRAAQHIYQSYAEIHPVRVQQVTGVTINRETFRGFVSFREGAVLLPGECFITVDQLVNDF